MSMRTRLRLEALERRLLLAGDVGAEINARGELIITGDDLDNSIEITAGEVDQLNELDEVIGQIPGYFVTGVATTEEGGEAVPTTVNGEEQAFFPAADVTNDLKIRLKGGNDTVKILGTVETTTDDQGNVIDETDVPLVAPDDIEVYPGAGDDTVIIDLVTCLDDVILKHKATVVEAGAVRPEAGNDSVAITNTTTTNDVRIYGYGGSLSVVVTDTVVGDDVAIRTAGGDDTITLGEGTVVDENLSIRTSNGNDIVSLNSADIGRSATIDMGSRREKPADGEDPVVDTVTIADSTIGYRLTVKTGAGNDAVSIAGTTVANDLKVSTRGGSDTLEITDNTVGDDVYLGTSGGEDTVTIQGTTVADRFSLSTGRGADNVTLADLDLTQNAIVNTSSGDDVVAATRLTVGNDLKIKTGSGNDTLTIAESTANDDAYLNTSKGDDQIEIDQLTVTDRFRLYTGAGADYVKLVDSVIAGKLSVSLGRHNDTLEAAANTAAMAVLDGGRGAEDEVKMPEEGDQVNDFTELTVRRFELPLDDLGGTQDNGLPQPAASPFDLGGMLRSLRSQRPLQKRTCR